ncbi:hypothetical protein CCACVL1_22734, partial [Corchorus capsularis]
AVSSAFPKNERKKRTTGRSGSRRINAASTEGAECLIAFLLDFKRFTTASVQKALERRCNFRGKVTVMGKDDHKYLVYLEEAAASRINYGTVEVYDLQNNLYSNRIRAFAYRRSRGTSRISYRGTPNENPQPEDPDAAINPQENINIQTRDDNVEMEDMEQQIHAGAQHIQNDGNQQIQTVPLELEDDEIVPINVNDGYEADSEWESDSHENQIVPSLPKSPSFGLEPIMGLEETRERLLSN